jgi:serine/threonine protein kinase
VQTDEQKRVCETEVRMLSKFGSHPNVVSLIDSVLRPSGRGRMDHLILLEFVGGGHVLDRVRAMSEGRERPWGLAGVVRALGQISLAVLHLHEADVTHRDLKLENFLLGQDGICRLCDFGSAVEGEVPLATQADRARAEEVIGKTTTQMYRAPEMVDLYMTGALTKATDVWALGCCLYTMAFFRNTFEEGSNLAILSAKYAVPPDHEYGPAVPTLLE